jgi:exosortase/archaeosortase family protein
MLLHSPTGIAYLPDGIVDRPERRPPRPARHPIFLFLAVFALLQWGWNSARGTWIERLVIDQATAVPAALLVRTLTPEISARASGPSIKAPGGGLNILNGCEGIEVMFLLIAAFAAIRMPWRSGLLALGAGLGWVFLLNQARILALFYTFRADRGWFDILHTAVLPAALVALTAGYFYVSLHTLRRRVA